MKVLVSYSIMILFSILLSIAKIQVGRRKKYLVELCIQAGYVAGVIMVILNNYLVRYAPASDTTQNKAYEELSATLCSSQRAPEIIHQVGVFTAAHVIGTLLSYALVNSLVYSIAIVWFRNRTAQAPE